MNILIPVEIASRELLYKSYLSHILAYKGFNCYLGKKGHISYLCNKFQNYIYFDKGYHQSFSEQIYENVRKQNGHIVSLDEEGAVDFSDNRTLFKRYPKTLFEQIDQVFLWGKNQEEIINEYCDNNKKIRVTGHPRFEMLNSKYRIFYDDEINKIKNRYKNYILINTNMGFGNNIKGDDCIRDKIIGYGTWYKNIDEIINHDKLKIDNYIDLVEKISKNYNGNIIFRPHPEENLEIYRNAFDKVKNVTINNKGSVIPWLIAADYMIHPDCTTSIESIILGKKAISFLPKNKDNDLITQLPVELSYKTTSIEEVISLIGKEKNNKLKINNNDIRFIEDSFSISSESNNLILDSLNTFLQEGNQNLSSTIKLYDKIILNYRSFKFSLNSSKAAELLKKKISGFNYDKIKTIHKNCIKYDNELSKIKVKKVSDALYHFYRD